MSNAPKIPYGYRAVPTGEQTRKGDGRWDGTRFRKIKPVMPEVGADIVIRKLDVTQPEIAGVGRTGLDLDEG